MAFDLRQTAQCPFEVALQGRHIDAGTRQQRGGAAIVLAEQRQQQVLWLNELLVVAIGQALGVAQGLLELGGEFVDSHGVLQSR